MDAFDLILPLVGLAVIAGAWLFHLGKRKKADASRNWPTAEARITCSQVVEKAERDSYGDANLAWYLEIAYDYEVSGQAHTGKKVSFASDNRFGKASEAQAIAERYPVGSTVQARVNPQNPKDAVLESARPGLVVPIILTAVGGLLILVGLSA